MDTVDRDADVEDAAAALVHELLYPAANVALEPADPVAEMTATERLSVLPTAVALCPPHSPFKGTNVFKRAVQRAQKDSGGKHPDPFKRGHVGCGIGRLE